MLFLDELIWFVFSSFGTHIPWIFEYIVHFVVVPLHPTLFLKIKQLNIFLIRKIYFRLWPETNRYNLNVYKTFKHVYFVSL